MLHESAELRVGLMPINPEAPIGGIVNLTCFYDHPSTLSIYFKLKQYESLPLTSWAMEPGPHVRTHRGASRVWNVHVGCFSCNVECVVIDHRGKELAVLSTTITPGSGRHVKNN